MAVRGRPRSFDREEALLSALEVFCARGYDGTTLQDLQAAMGGIAPPSFYAAFGSKEELFLEAVERYRTKLGDRPVRALESQPRARGAIEALLNEAVEVFGATDGPKGCLVILGGLNCTSPSIEAHLKTLRQQVPAVIMHRLERAVHEGDLPAGLDLSGIASFYATMIYGLALRARDGASRKALQASADGALAAWNTLTKAPATKAPAARASARPASRRR